MAIVTDEARESAHDPDVPANDRRDLAAQCIFVGACPSAAWLNARLHLFPSPGRFVTYNDAHGKRVAGQKLVGDDWDGRPRFDAWWSCLSRLNEAEHAAIADQLTHAVDAIQLLWQEHLKGSEPCRV